MLLAKYLKGLLKELMWSSCHLYLYLYLSSICICICIGWMQKKGRDGMEQAAIQLLPASSSFQPMPYHPPNSTPFLSTARRKNWAVVIALFLLRQVWGATWPFVTNWLFCYISYDHMNHFCFENWNLIWFWFQHTFKYCFLNKALEL